MRNIIIHDSLHFVRKKHFVKTEYNIVCQFCCLTSLSTIFRSYRDGAIAFFVLSMVCIYERRPGKSCTLLIFSLFDVLLALNFFKYLVPNVKYHLLEKGTYLNVVC